MTDFYRFPAMAKLNEWDNADQIAKIREEVEEAERAYFSVDNEIPYGIELMDIIHSAETALRMNFNDEEVSLIRELAIEKNRKRGYYDDDCSCQTTIKYTMANPPIIRR